MAREAAVQRDIWLAAAALAGTILFRLNTGRAWVSGAGPVRRMPNGDVVVPAGRPVALGFGLINGNPVVGAGDIVGWHTVEITPDMVGCRVAVFASIEAKRSDGGRVGADQARWRDTIIAAGGIATIASSSEEACAAIRGWRPPKKAA